jgi:hypothetical protein
LPLDAGAERCTGGLDVRLGELDVRGIELLPRDGIALPDPDRGELVDRGGLALLGMLELRVGGALVRGALRLGTLVLRGGGALVRGALRLGMLVLRAGGALVRFVDVAGRARESSPRGGGLDVGRGDEVPVVGARRATGTLVLVGGR